MNNEQIKEIRTVRGETAVNTLLTTNKWKIMEIGCDEDGVVALMVRLKD